MEERKILYRVYSEYLKEKYGEKVYKIPINLPVTCPNRDGNIAYGGCIYCGEEGAGYENLSNTLSVGQQMKENISYIRKKYKAQKFIGYFQNFTNTYMPLETFKRHVKEACIEDVVELSISTRPDCISNEYLDFLYKIKEEKGINITIELGLQSVNYHTLVKINRGHTLGEFIDGVNRIKKYDFQICAHLILNLPWDNELDVIESAKILSALNIDFVKLHSLYIEKNTVLGHQYEKGEVQLITKEEYVERVILFLEYLSPSIVMQRLIGRAPEETTLFMNWNTSWWKIRDQIEEEMAKRKVYQGEKCNYLNGPALKKFA
ncbi:TIGR01212 family radical SAM protein [Irregularibacter muris]|uniref:TIGR01212 family radical SAM protein n=1 Tax=Irregularibacter muris TaxID=1796619 RepID=A0AAE3L1W0_9FIRM|nr:TIGR01212 family radical SAM protein [Irregularibacter muris]MCR1897584.1 TIGR01212 family radical SAM protein [Irregularibacter muris]